MTDDSMWRSWYVIDVHGDAAGEDARDEFLLQVPELLLILHRDDETPRTLNTKKGLVFLMMTIQFIPAF